LLAEAEEEVEDEHADLIADILDAVGKIFIKLQFCPPTTVIGYPDTLVPTHRHPDSYRR
jgi:hypothetical protein